VAYTQKDINAWVLHIRKTSHRIVGFDVEWKPSKEPLASVVQLAIPGLALVAHVGVAKGLGKNLHALLEDPLIVKVGCGVDGDAKLVHARFGTVVRSCVDLVGVARCLGYPKPGLAGIAAAFGYALPKPEHVRMSDWSAYPLTADQVQYAALDAAASLWAALRLHHHHHTCFDMEPARPEREAQPPCTETLWPAEGVTERVRVLYLESEVIRWLGERTGGIA
jgi:ribonuclease D